MAQLDCKEIGQRIKMLRKHKGLNQKELAEILGKSLRTIQKYETGEIEVSISTVNQLAEILDSTSTYILGYETNRQPIQSLSDIMSFLFELEQVMDISREAIYTIIMTSAPLLLTSLVVGLIISIFQTVTSIQEQTLTFVPKILAVFAVMLLIGAWMLNNMSTFMTQLWSDFSLYV